MSNTKTYFVKHDYHARNDDKILQLRSEFGAEGYGVFWMIVETMAEHPAGCLKAPYLSGLSLSFGVDKEKLLKIIDYCVVVDLFYRCGEQICNKRIKDHKDLRTEKSETGKKHAHKRWDNDTETSQKLEINSKPNGLPMQDPLATHDIPNAERERESEKEEEQEKDTLPRERETKVVDLKTKTEHESGAVEVIYDLPKYLEENKLQFEAVCMSSGKPEALVRDVLKKFHLWKQEKNEYPSQPLALIAGLKRWILNEKDKKNGSYQQPPSAGGFKSARETKQAGSDQLWQHYTEVRANPGRI